ncbi:MAG: cytochrome c oxidase assembly protein [Proteobacteria bacterium]|nr:cytochrome c oxidase assembly protein [Pseudomonadota bacterium]
MHAMIRKLSFAAGVAAVAVAILPPLSGVAAQLFSAHMAQHLLLIAVAAPLLAASRAFESLQRFAAVRKLTQPVTAWVGFVGIFLFWHWPTAFQWAARNEATILLEHASILFAALLFWSVALSSRGQAWLSYGARALFVMTAAVVTDLPGVIMLFAPRAICVMPGENAPAFGITPLEDQQIAGLLMWVPANLVFFGTATWLFALWISDTHKHSSQVTT